MIPRNLLEKARAKGGDKDFAAYSRLWPCVFTGFFHEIHDGQGKSVYAHINRVSRGSGTSHKTAYSGVPTLNEIHADLMHQKGETPKLRAWLDEKSIEMLTNWVYDVPPPCMEDYYKSEQRVYILDFPELSEGVLMGVKRCMHRRISSGRAIEMTLKRAGKKRSNAQNSAQFGVIYAQIEKAFKDNPALLGNFMFMIADTVCKQTARKPYQTMIHEGLKIICNEGKSTTTLGTDTWGDSYVEAIYHLMNEEFGIALDMPHKG